MGRVSMRTSSLFPVAAFLFRCIFFTGVALPSFMAHGNAVDYTPFSARYPSYYSAHGCDSCHTASIPARNSYGEAYRIAVVALGGRTGSNPLNAIISIETGDADADGYTNGSELR